MTEKLETRIQQASDRQAEGALFEAAWRERFESFAEQRDDDAGIAGWSSTGLDARMRRFTALWRTGRSGERWLDAGCGAGSYSRFLLAQGHRVIGIDYSMPTIVKAQARSSKEIAFVVGDVRRLPFVPQTFDGVLCFGVLQALAENEAALRSLTSLVHASGELWVDALNRACVVNAGGMLWRRMWRRRPHLRYDSPHAVRRLLCAQGFTEVSIFWMPIVPSRWPRMQRTLERPLIQRLLQAVPLLGILASHSFIVRGRRPVGVVKGQVIAT